MNIKGQVAARMPGREKKREERSERKDQKKFGKMMKKFGGYHKDPEDDEARVERMFQSDKAHEAMKHKEAKIKSSLAGKFKAGIAKREKEEPARKAALDKMFGVKRN